MDISGATKLFAIIGRPVETVFSPPAYNAWFRAQRLDIRMVALDVAPEALHEFVTVMRHSRSFLGCSVTYPHKQAAYDMCDHKTNRAKRLGALNTLKRFPDGTLSGEATDGLAMVGAIDSAGLNLAGKSATVLGAGGGAGQAIADAFCAAAIAQISLRDLNPEREAQVTDGLRHHWPNRSITNDAVQSDILVNATTLGTSPRDALPFTPAQIEAATMVCDVVIGDMDTPLITLAKEQKKQIATGRNMGRCQLEPQLRHLGLYR